MVYAENIALAIRVFVNLVMRVGESATISIGAENYQILIEKEKKYIETVPTELVKIRTFTMGMTSNIYSEWVEIELSQFGSLDISTDSAELSFRIEDIYGIYIHHYGTDGRELVSAEFE